MPPNSPTPSHAPRMGATPIPTNGTGKAPRAGAMLQPTNSALSAAPVQLTAGDGLVRVVSAGVVATATNARTETTASSGDRPAASLITSSTSGTGAKGSGSVQDNAASARAISAMAHRNTGERPRIPSNKAPSARARALAWDASGCTTSAANVSRAGIIHHQAPAAISADKATTNAGSNSIAAFRFRGPKLSQRCTPSRPSPKMGNATPTGVSRTTARRVFVPAQRASAAAASAPTAQAARL